MVAKSLQANPDDNTGFVVSTSCMRDYHKEFKAIKVQCLREKGLNSLPDPSRNWRSCKEFDTLFEKRPRIYRVFIKHF